MHGKLVKEVGAEQDKLSGIATGIGHDVIAIKGDRFGLLGLGEAVRWLRRGLSHH
jgi:hypothetical protein